MSRIAASLSRAPGLYPERADDEQLGWVEQRGRELLRKLRRDGNAVARFPRLLAQIERFGREYAPYTDMQLAAVAASLRRELRRQGFQEALVANAFALIREQAQRRLGIRHRECQLMGGWAMLHGMVAEMETGEGKTLTATLAAGVVGLAGFPVHIVTVNDYLVRRDAEAMAPIFTRLNLSVGMVTADSDPAAKRAAYRSAVTYTTNKTLVFDYLRDRITLGNRAGPLRLAMDGLYGGRGRAEKLLLRGLSFAIVDEADSVLIDEARTPLIISGAAENVAEAQHYREALELGRRLERDVHFTSVRHGRAIELTGAGKGLLADRTRDMGALWQGPLHREEVLVQALTALHLFRRDEHYMVADGKIVIVDEYTGRPMPDRSWNRGLQQLIEIKENCAVTAHREPLARISYQRFFRRYLHLAGMTGTAREVADELLHVYSLAVVSIPTHRPVLRQYRAERIYPTSERKWEAVTQRIHEVHGQGRPVLVGTRTVEASEVLSAYLARAGLPHRVLNARRHDEEARIVAEAGKAGRITIATNMAGRGTDIKLDDEAIARRGLLVILTERHAARRIDRQLFGRCARQGDPGGVESILSLEDDLAASYGGPVIRWLVPRPRIVRSFAGQRLARFAMGRAQRRLEHSHYRTRKRLLQADREMGDILAFTGYSE